MLLWVLAARRSSSMGLSMANMVDPNIGNVPVIAQFLIVCSTLIFWGWAAMIIVSLVLESFQLLPIGELIELQALIGLIIEWSSMMFLGALLLGMPIIASLLLINIGLTLLQEQHRLGNFCSGFPAMILAGMVLLVSMTSIGARIRWLWQESFDILAQALGVK